MKNKVPQLQSADSEDNISAFAELARGFCAWCESTSLAREPETEAASWLAVLYAGALRLPRVKLTARARHTHVTVGVDWQMPNISYFMGSYYRQFFDPDPKITVEPVMGLLGDDLLDTYRDVKTGLLMFDAGRSNSAVWQWRFFHRIHWGHHAVGALFGLHCLGISKMTDDEPC